MDDPISGFSDPDSIAFAILYSSEERGCGFQRITVEGKYGATLQAFKESGINEQISRIPLVASDILWATGMA
jgi:hypothetical protein